MDQGKICQNETHNRITQKKLFNLVQLLIINGAKLLKSQLQSNILFNTFNFQNEQLLKLIIQVLHPQPIKNHYHYHSCSYCHNEHNYDIDRFCYEGIGNEFITRAIKTNNLEKVKTACQFALQYDIQPDTSETSKNALTNAVLTGDPEIVKEIIMIGGLPNNIDTNPLYQWRDVRRDSTDTFEILYREYIENDNYYVDMYTIEQIIDLLFCTGASLPYCTFLDILHKEENNCIELKLINYFTREYKIMRPHKNKKILSALSENNKQEIETKLKSTAEDLIKKSKQTIRRREIEDIIISIPICCIDIIFEYQHESRLRIINLPFEY